MVNILVILVMGGLLGFIYAASHDNLKADANQSEHSANAWVETIDVNGTKCIVYHGSGLSCDFKSTKQ